MSKSQIVDLGMNKEARRTAKRTAIILLCLAVVVGLGVIWKIVWLSGVSTLSFLIYLIVWQLQCTNKGKKMWKENKDKPEPVKM